MVFMHGELGSNGKENFWRYRVPAIKSAAPHKSRIVRRGGTMVKIRAPHARRNPL